ETRERIVKLDVTRGVLLRELIDFFRRCGGVGEKRERLAIGRRREKANRRFKALETELGELHVFEDRSKRRAAGMRERGATETGMKFFGDGRAANDRAAFENERPKTFLGEIKRGDEGVVSRAENHDIALNGHYFCPASFK